MSPVFSSITKAARLFIAVLALFAWSTSAALAAPAASESGTVELTTTTQDLRSPDAVDAATPRLDVRAQDLRSPDAIDAATDRLDVSAQDLRSPDAVDAATLRLDGAVDGAGVQSTASEASGFDWSSAGIAMAALLGLVIAAAAAATHVRHSRRTVARP